MKVNGAALMLNILFISILNDCTRANAKQADSEYIWYFARGLDGGLVKCTVASVFFSILFYPMSGLQLAMTASLHEIPKRQLNSPIESLCKRQI